VDAAAEPRRRSVRSDDPVPRDAAEGDAGGGLRDLVPERFDVGPSFVFTFAYEITSLDCPLGAGAPTSLGM